MICIWIFIIGRVKSKPAPVKETEVQSLNSMRMNITPLGLIVNLHVLADINSHYLLVTNHLFSYIDLLSDGDQLYIDENQRPRSRRALPV